MQLFLLLNFLPICWQNIMESTLRDIVSHELEKIKQSSSHENQTNLTSYNNDFVWEFDGLNEERSTEIESEDLMLEMQRLLYEDLREEFIRRGIVLLQHLLALWYFSISRLKIFSLALLMKASMRT